MWAAHPCRPCSGTTYLRVGLLAGTEDRLTSRHRFVKCPAKFFSAWNEMNCRQRGLLHFGEQFSGRPINLGVETGTQLVLLAGWGNRSFVPARWRKPTPEGSQPFAGGCGASATPPPVSRPNTHSDAGGVAALPRRVPSGVIDYSSRATRDTATPPGSICDSRRPPYPRVSLRDPGLMAFIPTGWGTRTFPQPAEVGGSLSN